MNTFFVFGINMLIFMNAGLQPPSSLVPSKPSNAPDYFCTWNVQGYVCSYLTNEDERKAMNEKNMFGDSAYQNWLGFFPNIRKDLFFVMDDSWDVPPDENSMQKNDYLGTVELNQARFPSFTGNATERLKKLVGAVKEKGWKGLGGWICAQEAPVFNSTDSIAYWTARMKTANESGFGYWKVDWGKKTSEGWRKMLTRLGHTYSPNLIIEHALEEKFVTIADVYRTYDVENIIAQPVTIGRIAALLKYKPLDDVKSIINCEDEPYIAAGLGCSIGIMRHPFAGKLPNNTVDFCFPPVGRNLKNRLDEVSRGVRWHRIAEPFGIGSNNFIIDTLQLNDYWVMGEKETWVGSRKNGDTLRVSAPAKVSRGLALPVVANPSPSQPFLLSSRYPNGAIAIVTIGRALNRSYITERLKVEQSINSLNKPIGIFGDYESLTLRLPAKIKAASYVIFGQDLAGNTPINITKEIIIKGSTIVIPGETIRRVGLSAATKGDISDPGMVIQFFSK